MFRKFSLVLAATTAIGAAALAPTAASAWGSHGGFLGGFGFHGGFLDGGWGYRGWGYRGWGGGPGWCYYHPYRCDAY